MSDKPSPKQVYKLAHLMADALEVPWPESRGAASELIGRLMALQGDMPAPVVSDPLAPVGYTVTLEDGRRGVVQAVDYVIEWGEDAWQVSVDDGPTFSVAASHCTLGAKYDSQPF